ncbi:MAG: hypothetical protein IT167_25765 [Bryobacterales bacterium]|nr:hypothetical protein [Bryobacterales bacterium]
MSRISLAFALLFTLAICARADSAVSTPEVCPAIQSEIGSPEVAPLAIEAGHKLGHSLTSHVRKVWMGLVSVRPGWALTDPPSTKEYLPENTPVTRFLHKKAGRGPPRDSRSL